VQEIEVLSENIITTQEDFVFKLTGGYTQEESTLSLLQVIVKFSHPRGKA